MYSLQVDVQGYTITLTGSKLLRVCQIFEQLKEDEFIRPSSLPNDMIKCWSQKDGLLYNQTDMIEKNQRKLRIRYIQTCDKVYKNNQNSTNQPFIEVLQKENEHLIKQNLKIKSENEQLKTRLEKQRSRKTQLEQMWINYNQIQKKSYQSVMKEIWSQKNKQPESAQKFNNIDLKVAGKNATTQIAPQKHTTYPNQVQKKVITSMYTNPLSSKPYGQVPQMPSPTVAKQLPYQNHTNSQIYSSKAPQLKHLNFMHPSQKQINITSQPSSINHVSPSTVKPPIKTIKAKYYSQFL